MDTAENKATQPVAAQPVGIQPDAAHAKDSKHKNSESKPKARHSIVGPALFIMAVLALLAASVAAMIGNPKRGMIDEENRTKVLALIRAGENLKLGMDRVMLGKGVSAADVDMAISDLASPNQLFSPVGGGIAPPSTGMANNPSVDKWLFPKGNITGLGLGTSTVVMAVLAVSEGVCAAVNKKAVGEAFLPGKALLGDFGAAVLSVAPGQWPHRLFSAPMGCVANSGVRVDAAGPTSPYFFYQVLAME